MMYFKLFLFFIPFSTSVFAQQNNELLLNETFLGDYERYSHDVIEQIYQNAMVKDLSYVNGREYKQYHYSHHSNPYLNSTDGVGTIYIDGVSFKDKVLRYDLFQDKLVLIPLELELTGVFIELNKSKIDSFDIKIDNQSFKLVNVSFDADTITDLKSGYYEIPYSGEYRLLIKHSVSLRKEDGYDRYDYKQVFYLNKDGKYHRITSKRKFLHLFVQDKKRLQGKCRSIGIPFKRMGVQEKVELVKYAESL